jgi:type VI secretion system secreted protein VgrG
MAKSSWTQDRRLLEIETSLGKDKVLLTSLAGREAMSELFSYDIEMLSTDRDISAETMIGDKVTLWLMTETGKFRPIHGMVAQWRAGPVVIRDLRQYRAHVVPWPWYLGHTTDCRIFQNLNVPDIIEQVFKTFGFTDYEMSLARGEYPKLEFCVQYRETALNFVSRLMEEVGIFYFFRHEESRHVMVIADKNASFKPLPQPELTWHASNAAWASLVTGWEHSFEFRPGKWAQRDYNFETPSSDLTTNEKTLLKLRTASRFERFDYPGQYLQKGRGTQLTKTLMQVEEAAYHSVLGASTCTSLDIGRRFTLGHHPIEKESSAYVISSVRHMATDTTHLTHADKEPCQYENSFEAVPFDVPYRPVRATEKPFVHGPQTAVVVGPAGEEIYTDKYGRIKVQFHWDRQGKKDENSSCFVRVAQSWAGRNFGTIFLPRIGQEVVVAFEEGNPDRPLVVGSVYNAEQMVPFGLPDNKTQSGLRTRSSLGGGAANCNELVFEDRKGSELVKLHAEKDLSTGVEHDATHWVGHDETTTIDNDRTETVHANETITIDKNRTETVHQNETVTIDLNRTHTIGVIDMLTVGAARMHSVGAAEQITVGAAQSITVGASQSFTVGANQSTSVGRNQSTSVGRDQSTSVGQNRAVSVAKDDSLDVGKNLTITAGDQIVRKTGSATITMKKNGDITIQGKQINIKGSGDVIVKGQKILQN